MSREGLASLLGMAADGHRMESVSK
jgi:hypothetical protein